jgi:hypothetical protein
MPALPNIRRGSKVAIGVSWSKRHDLRLKRDFLDRLEARLNPRTDFTFNVWDSEMTPIGEDWKPLILRELAARPFAMPLLSPAYLSSKFITTYEWPLAASSILLPVGLVPIDLTPEVLTPGVSRRQIFTVDRGFYSQMKGNQAKNDFVDAFVKAMVARLATLSLTAA